MVEKQKNTSKIKKWYIIIFIVVAIVFSLVLTKILSNDTGPTEYKPGDTYTINGYTFQKGTNDLWVVQIYAPKVEQTYNLFFHYMPLETNNTVIERNALGKILNSKIIYLTTDPKSPSHTIMAIFDLGKILGTKYHILDIPTGQATTYSTEKTANITQANCKNATENTRVVLFEINNQTETPKAYLDRNCVIVSANNGEDLIKLADRMAFMLLRII